MRSSSDCLPSAFIKVLVLTRGNQMPFFSTNKNVSFIYLTSCLGNGFFERGIWMLFLIEKGFSLFQIGLLQAFVNGTMFLFEIPGGMLADRYGRKVSLLIGRFMIMSYLLIIMIADSFGSLALSFCLLGLGMTFISGSEESLLVDSVKEQTGENNFSRFLGRYMAIITVALSLAMMIGGFLKEISWSLVFAVSFIFQLIAFFGCFFLKETKYTKGSRRESFTLIFKDTFNFLKTNNTSRTLIFGIALFTGIGSIFYMFAQELFNQLGIKVYLISIFFGLESFLAAILSDRAYILEKKFSSKRVMMVCVYLCGISFLLIYINFNWLILSFFIISAFYNLFTTISYSVINQDIPSKQRATLLSIISFISSLVMFISIPIFGYLSDEFGTAYLLSFTGVISMVLVALSIISFYKNRKDSVEKHKLLNVQEK